MNFGLLAPALIGGVVAILGFIILAWMKHNKPRLDVPSKEEAQELLPLDFDALTRPVGLNIIVNRERTKV